jgi:hypothetical protein
MSACDAGATAQDSARIAARFLRSVFSGHEAGFVALFYKPSKHSTFVPLNNQDWYTEAAKNAIVAREKENVYFAIGVQGQQPNRGRGKQGGVIARPELMRLRTADIRIDWDSTTLMAGQDKRNRHSI